MKTHHNIQKEDYKCLICFIDYIVYIAKISLKMLTLSEIIIVKYVDNLF